jgi:ABC-type polar amino acid transport system ATPase subunit
MGFAKAAADEIIFMDMGKIVERAAPEVFFEHLPANEPSSFSHKF